MTRGPTGEKAAETAPEFPVEKEASRRRPADSKVASARGGMGAKVERPGTAPRRLEAGGAPKRGGAVGLSATHVECVSRQITGGVQQDPLCIPCNPLSRSESENRPGSPKESKTASTPPRFDARILHASHVSIQVWSGSRSTSILLPFHF